MFPAEILRTTSFRLALGASAILLLSTAVVFALITWQAERFENARIDRLIAGEAASLAREQPATIRWHVDRHFDEALRSLPVTGVFDRDGRTVDGDLAGLPTDFPVDGRVHPTVVGIGGRALAVRAVAVRLPSGGSLLIGRDMRELASLRSIVLRGLALGFVPALALSLVGGALIGYRGLLRIREMHRAIARIMAGGLHERLPSGGGRDDLDLLAGSVNRMLDRLELLVSEVRGIGDDIAHDLRTPLARVRATLDRARTHAVDRAGIDDAIDRAIADLDRAFTVITALLRIAAIETERRVAGFGDVSLAPIARDAVEFYEPMAEAKGIALLLDVAADGSVPVRGDPDLLMEAVANLLDNALKFTPPGGHVTVTVRDGLLTVADDGIGLSEADRGSVLKRFYRADRSRHVPGNGLGLSLVAAIAALHDTEVLVESAGRGSRFSLRFGRRHLNGNFIEAGDRALYKPGVLGRESPA